MPVAQADYTPLVFMTGFILVLRPKPMNTLQSSKWVAFLYQDMGQLSPP
jgi:hypothetical protein